MRLNRKPSGRISPASVDELFSPRLRDETYFGILYDDTLNTADALVKNVMKRGLLRSVRLRASSR